MKKLFLVFALICAQSVFAQEQPDKLIYDALNVEEESVISAAAQNIKEKAVGGFMCRKVSDSIDSSNAPTSYDCSFDSQREDYDHQAIYEALSVEESSSRNRHANAGRVKKKKVAHLTCTKSPLASGEFRFVCFM